MTTVFGADRLYDASGRDTATSQVSALPFVFINITGCTLIFAIGDCRHPAKAGGPLWIPASAGMTTVFVADRLYAAPARHRNLSGFCAPLCFHKYRRMHL
jgi:hypothetical protein